MAVTMSSGGPPPPGLPPGHQDWFEPVGAGPSAHRGRVPTDSCTCGLPGLTGVATRLGGEVAVKLGWVEGVWAGRAPGEPITECTPEDLSTARFTESSGAGGGQWVRPETQLPGRWLQKPRQAPACAGSSHHSRTIHLCRGLPEQPRLLPRGPVQDHASCRAHCRSPGANQPARQAGPVHGPPRGSQCPWPGPRCAAQNSQESAPRTLA